MADESEETEGDSEETDGGAEAKAEAPPESGSGAEGLDLDAERERLDQVEDKIEEGRRALADAQDDVRPDSDGPPIAAGEGAANAPPG